MSEVHEDSFIFYRSFYEAMEGLPDGDRLALYDAIVKLALDGEKASLPSSVRGLFILIVPQIEANIRKRVVGRTGGRPPKKETNGFPPTETNGYSDEKPNYNDNGTVNLKNNAHGVCKGLNGEGCGDRKEGEVKNNAFAAQDLIRRISTGCSL